jgi:hypothetical protein
MKKPYLIQRGSFRGPSISNEAVISDAVSLEYMGSAEFEFGALPQSLRKMAENGVKDPSTLTVRELPDIRDRSGRPMLVIGISESNVAQYQDFILPFLGESPPRIKEDPQFEDMTTPLDKLPSYHPLRRDPPKGHRRGAKKEEYLAKQDKYLTKFWWDLTNNAMMSFEADRMAAIPENLAASWSRMNEYLQKKAEQAPSPTEKASILRTLISLPKSQAEPDIGASMPRP